MYVLAINLKYLNQFKNFSQSNQKTFLWAQSSAETAGTVQISYDNNKANMIAYRLTYNEPGPNKRNNICDDTFLAID